MADPIVVTTADRSGQDGHRQLGAWVDNPISLNADEGAGLLFDLGDPAPLSPNRFTAAALDLTTDDLGIAGASEGILRVGFVPELAPPPYSNFTLPGDRSEVTIGQVSRSFGELETFSISLDLAAMLPTLQGAGWSGRIALSCFYTPNPGSTFFRPKEIGPAPSLTITVADPAPPPAGVQGDGGGSMPSPDFDLPQAPQDLFSTEVSPVLDEARQIIADQGLRPYRVFLVIEKFEGPERRQGDLIERELREILPPPHVEFHSTFKVAMSQGLLQEGSATLHEITRTLRKEELRGRTLNGDKLPDTWDFAIALQPLGQILAEFYVPAADPILRPTAWQMGIRPINRRENLVIGPDNP